MHRCSVCRDAASALLSRAMQLLTVHRILIGSAIVVFAGYAVREAFAYAAGDAEAIVGGLVSLAGAAALLAYLRWLRRHRRA